MDFHTDRPIYLQIMDFIIQQIVSGKLKPGDKVKAVREMAVELATNPNTVQRALQELEREAILFSKRGLGRFVTEDRETIRLLQKQAVGNVIENFLVEMKKFGWTQEQAKDLLGEYIEREKER
ncbi:GntR family transcriptional regulator [Enterococcus crotali]|uniref:GntR family transcriptional regulator n=1 Tax=Enterococcus crotali TaxID=1453587 RepID=UPI00046FE841|nr:GntR family transcriptional regulator [Enterococcus crotali]